MHEVLGQNMNMIKEHFSIFPLAFHNGGQQDSSLPPSNLTEII